MAIRYSVKKIANSQHSKKRIQNALVAALGAGANPQNKEKRHMAKAKPKAKKHAKHAGHNPTLMFRKPEKKNGGARRHKPRTAQNPFDIRLGGQVLPAKSAVKILLGGLLGVAGTKMATPLLANAVNLDTSSNVTKTAATAAVAFAGGKAAEAIDKEIGLGYQFGAYMHTFSLALNTFVPQVGSKIALNGGRGVGRYVQVQQSRPGAPPTLVLDPPPATAAVGSNSSSPMTLSRFSRAYPSPYGGRRAA